MNKFIVNQYHQVKGYDFNDKIEVPVIFTDRSEGTSKMSEGIFFEAVVGVLEMKIKSFFRKFDR